MGVVWISFILMGNSCTKDRFPSEPNDSLPNIKTDSIPFHSLYINELVAKGSNLTYDLGKAADWIEIYNPTDTVFTLFKNQWFLSDDSTELEKFTISSNIAIQPKSFLVIFCDDSTRITQFIHTNFGLSSGGDNIYLSYKNSNSIISVIDSKSFGPQDSNVSLGRSPDGTENWTSFLNPTPGQSNF